MFKAFQNIYNIFCTLVKNTKKPSKIAQLNTNFHNIKSVHHQGCYIPKNPPDRFFK